MYSVVLMVALTGSGDQPAGLFSHGCCGGSSCYGGCYGSGCCGGKHHGGGCCGGKHHGGGCCGGCWGGCTGGKHHGCCGGGHKHHGGGCCGGCYGGCCGGWGGCSGSCYGGGCWGGCTGYGCTGAGYGCVGAGYAGGCVGLTPSMPVAPVTPVIPDGGKTKTDDGKTKTELTVPAPATIVVTLPADARLMIDDAATASTSERRVFVSPSLNPGREYHYTLKAEWTVDGKTMAATKEIAVRAGNETRVNFEPAALPAVAAR